jgi:hypothetical protein
MCAMSEPNGPIENGTTYMVRPRIDPSNNPCSLRFMTSGASQLLVGPASCLLTLQMKVRSSTRATSLGSERARKQFGRFSALSLVNVPAATSSPHSFWYSSSEPSQKWTRSGLHKWTMLSIHARSCVCLM